MTLMEDVLELDQDRRGDAGKKDDWGNVTAAARQIAQDASDEVAEQDQDVSVEGDHLVVAGPDVDHLRMTRHRPEGSLENEAVQVIWSQIPHHFADFNWMCLFTFNLNFSTKFYRCHCKYNNLALVNFKLSEKLEYKFGLGSE